MRSNPQIDELMCYGHRNERYDGNEVQIVRYRGHGFITIWGGILGLQKNPLTQINGRLRAADYVSILSTQVVYMFHDNVDVVDIFGAPLFVRIIP